MKYRQILSVVTDIGNLRLIRDKELKMQPKAGDALNVTSDEVRTVAIVGVNTMTFVRAFAYGKHADYLIKALLNAGWTDDTTDNH